MMKSVAALALLLGVARAQEACHEALFQGVLAMAGCTGDCTNCHVDNVNTVLCPNNVCCTLNGVAQAAGDTAVGGTAPTICTSSTMPATASCTADGDACTHFAHDGVCNAQLQCIDTNVCSAAKIAQRDLCAADCTVCNAGHIDAQLNGCTLADGTTEAYGTTFCVPQQCTAMDSATIQAAGYAVAGAGDATTTEGLGAVSCHTTHVAEDASGAATTPSVSCDGTDFAWTGCTPKGSCSTNAVSCPNSNQLANYNTVDGTDEATCCEPVAVAGKCGGNDDSATDYTCPTGYDLKANPAGIDSASTDTADARTAACCDAQTCAADVCTTGYTAKADQTLAAGTAATLENCCDAAPVVATPPPADPASSGTTVTAVTAAALLGVAAAQVY